MCLAAAVLPVSLSKHARVLNTSRRIVNDLFSLEWMDRTARDHLQDAGARPAISN